MDSFTDKVDIVVTGFMDALEKRGIYTEMLSTGVGATEEVNPEILEDLDSETVQNFLSVGQIKVIGQFRASLGEFAWEERNLFPDKFEEQVSLSEELMLDEEEIMRSSLERNANDWWESD